MILTNYKNRGFTIVELLIVIVVIAILASITIVSYNGIQNRAKATAATSTAANVAKKAELVNVLKGSYPTSITDFNDYSESKIAGSGLILGTPLSTSGTNTVSYEYCPAGGGAAAGGGRIRTWDYNTGALSATYTYIGPATGGATCTGTWTAITGS